MRAIDVVSKADGDTLSCVELADPVAGPGQLRIAVEAFGINRADLLQRAGRYPAPPGESQILGLEVAGRVESLGDAALPFRVGDRVCALLAGGGYAEKVVVPGEQVMLLPDRYSFTEGAAIPEAFITAYANLFCEGGLEAGQRVLIHGGSSGVGTAALQLAKYSGAIAACTVGSDTKAHACRTLGAECTVNYRTHDFEVEVGAWTNQGVDVILDIVGREYFEKNVRLLAPGGRLVCIATMSGADCSLDLRLLMRKRARIIGSVLRTRSAREKGGLVAGFQARFGDALSRGEVRPVVDSVFSFDQVVEAHDRMRSSEHVGKIVVTLS
jgi:putative PIG3 family NAD(P)H quinone oxidoreductase